MMYVYHFHPELVYDGDSVKGRLDLGLRTWRFGEWVRLVGENGRWFDAPEMRGAERVRGIIARDRVREWLSPHLAGGEPLVIQTFKPDPADAFGRWLARVIHPFDVTERLVAEGLGEYRPIANEDGK